jgi:pyruvate dehydrogenase E1 component alpha subunit
MEKEVSFRIPFVQFLDSSGNLKGKSSNFPTNSEIKEIYKLMVLTRTFDEKSLNLQRQGRIGTYAQIKGQEACQIPSAIQMQKEDLAFPAFREHGLFITRDVPLEKLFQYWSGDERGMLFKNNVFPVAITVGGHLPHAVGFAMGNKMQNKKAVSLVYFGDGATSEGDFHEALNFAGVFKAPVIFFCQNNQYAISTPVSEQTASKTIAQKAIAYGIEGVQVDGNDVFAVYSATKEAIKKARSGIGPTLIECITYRLADHTTSDDAKRYRKEAELKSWISKDPIIRLRNYMFKQKLLTESENKKIIKDAFEKVENAVKKFENINKENPEEIFNYTFESSPILFQEQKEDFKKEVQ